MWLFSIIEVFFFFFKCMILFPSLLFVEHKVVREKWDRRFGLHLEIQLSKEKTLFFFSFIALFLTVYLSQFSLTLSIFLFSFACSQSRSSSRLHCPQSCSLEKLLSPLMDHVTYLPFY